MIYGLELIILGILAVPSLLLSRKPDAKELLDKITPYQGWIGVVFCIAGLWGIVQCILNLNWLSFVPLVWIMWTLVSVVQAALGFIMGYGLIAKYVLSKNPKSAEKGEQLLAKLIPLQGKLGIAAIILGAVYIVLTIIY
ncbi:MAG: hypothetical protein LIP01_09760 [Tannerellaceae bacterium]|nr:hypothetical protein [Tannerellaceae bacterium]